MENLPILRAVKKEDLEILYEWNNPNSIGGFQEFIFESFLSLEKKFSENGFMSEDFKMLIIEIENKPIGRLTMSKVRDGVVRIGGSIAIEEKRNQNIGTKVLKMFVQYLFQNYPIVRIEADTDIDNIPAQKVLEKNGFLKEGILRKYRFHHGKFRDFAMYSIIK